MNILPRQMLHIFRWISTFPHKPSNHRSLFKLALASFARLLQHLHKTAKRNAPSSSILLLPLARKFQQPQDQEEKEVSVISSAQRTEDAGSGGIPPPILNLGIRQRWEVSFISQTLHEMGKISGAHCVRSWAGHIAGVVTVVIKIKFRAPTGNRNAIS
jgi:hypothetical protein